jgi:serine/threonine protein kinase
MALQPGFRLGPYEVTVTLGEGGMGQVYRARDTRLKRDVALKILPASFASDVDRLARFQRESTSPRPIQALAQWRQFARAAAMAGQ